MVPLLRVAAEVVPHQVVDDALGHALRLQIARVEALVAPLHPPGRCRAAVDEAERAHLVAVAEREARQDVRAGADAEPDHRLQAEVGQDEEQLRGQLVHRRVLVAATAAGR